jgi:N-acetylglucosamine kinase-like BadF-type ATPase
MPKKKSPHINPNQTYLILDGGGTSLKIFLQTSDLHLSVQTLSGNFNFQSGNRAVIVATLAKILKQYPETPAVIGLAGLLTTSNKTELAASLCEQIRELRHSPVLLSDLELLFELHFPNQDGTVVILGTGSVFAAQYRRVFYKVGGYGKLFGDDGSGYQLGQSAAAAYLKLLDGFFTDKKFETAMRDIFPTKEDVIQKVYREDFELQSLAPLVMQLYTERSVTAKTLLAQSVRLVNENLNVLSAKMNHTKPPLLLKGGLVESVNPYSRLLRKDLETNGWTVHQ